MGKDEKGGNYYNKYEIIKLTPEQQETCTVADGSYRPCCGNSTSFPDCNHGAALSIIELGVARIITRRTFDVAVKFNFSGFRKIIWKSLCILKLRKISIGKIQ